MQHYHVLLLATVHSVQEVRQTYVRLQGQLHIPGAREQQLNAYLLTVPEIIQ